MEKVVVHLELRPRRGDCVREEQDVRKKFEGGSL